MEGWKPTKLFIIFIFNFVNNIHKLLFISMLHLRPVMQMPRNCSIVVHTSIDYSKINILALFQ